MFNHIWSQINFYPIESYNHDHNMYWEQLFFMNKIEGTGYYINDMLFIYTYIYIYSKVHRYMYLYIILYISEKYIY